ncbi:MAG: hypothetical protein ACRD3M_02310 [Thermoanaerobaculia bacterium]
MDRRGFLRVLAVLASSPIAFPVSAASPKLEELADLEQFRRLFNQGRGIPRIVLLLSPT